MKAILGLMNGFVDDTDERKGKLPHPLNARLAFVSASYHKTYAVSRLYRLVFMVALCCYLLCLPSAAQLVVSAQFRGEYKGVPPCGESITRPVALDFYPLDRWVDDLRIHATTFGMLGNQVVDGKGRVERSVKGRLVLFFQWFSESPPPDDLKRFKFVSKSYLWVSGVSIFCGGCCSGASTSFDTLSQCGEPHYNESHEALHMEDLNLVYEPVVWNGVVQYWLATYELDVEVSAWAEVQGSCDMPCLEDIADGWANLVFMVTNRSVMLELPQTYKKGFDRDGRAVPVPNDCYKEGDTSAYAFDDGNTWVSIAHVNPKFVGQWRQPECYYNSCGCHLVERSRDCLYAIFQVEEPGSLFPIACEMQLFSRDIDGYSDWSSAIMRMHLPLEKDRLLASEPFTEYDGVIAGIPARNGSRAARAEICASQGFSFTWTTTVSGGGHLGLEIGREPIKAVFGADFSVSVSLSELQQMGLTLCLSDIQLNAYEWIVPVYVPFGYKELWLCDVYNRQGFAGQANLCHYTRPHEAPYCYFTYIILPAHLRTLQDVYRYITSVSVRGICSPRAPRVGVPVPQQ